jgi:PEGA domain
MHISKPIRFAVALSIFVALFWQSRVSATQNQVMGEVKFSGANKADKNAGVWVDGQYLGYLKELKGDKQITLLPGSHDIAIRQAGYEDFTRTVVVEPGGLQEIVVHMQKDPRAIYPGKDAAVLKVDISPDRSAVFLDDGYVGHAGDFGGALHSMMVVPGQHRIKIELPGYQTFETVINVLPGQKAEIKTDLVRGSIIQAGALIKER